MSDQPDPVIADAYRLAINGDTRAGFNLLVARINEQNALLAAYRSQPAHRPWWATVLRLFAIILLFAGLAAFGLSLLEQGAENAVASAELVTLCEDQAAPTTDCDKWAKQAARHDAAKRCTDEYEPLSNSLQMRACLVSGGVALWGER